MLKQPELRSVRETKLLITFFKQLEVFKTLQWDTLGSLTNSISIHHLEKGAVICR